MRWILVAAVLFSLSCAAAPPIEPTMTLEVSGSAIGFLGDGPGCANPIVILDAPDDETCDEAQYEWLTHHLGDYEVQAAQMYDVKSGISGVAVESSAGNRLYCFDISECWTPPDWAR